MPEPMIHNAGELEVLAQRMGLLPFFACGISGFSITRLQMQTYVTVHSFEYRTSVL